MAAASLPLLRFGAEASHRIRLFSASITSSLFSTVSCASSSSTGGDEPPLESLDLKLVAVAAILIFGAAGVWLPLAGRKRRWQITDGAAGCSPAFAAIKSFAAGVVLATGFVHMLHGSEHALSNPCLPETPWRIFPFPGFVAMAASLITLVADCIGTQFFQKKHKDGMALNGSSPSSTELLPTRSNGHGHGEMSSEIRNTVLSQILELGIVSHSVIIGLSLGVSRSPATIQPLVAALSFHQFFEGFALGGCISQAKFSGAKMFCMAAFFAITTPAGIGVGIAVSSFYNPNSPVALIVEGLLDATSAGILIYMALVDLIAADFLSGKLTARPKLQLISFVFLFLGALAMSLLAIWA